MSGKVNSSPNKKNCPTKTGRSTFFGGDKNFLFFCATRYALNCKKNETVTATFTYEQKNVRRYATDNFEFSKRPRHIKRRNRKTLVPTRNHPPNRSNFSSKKNSLKFPTNSTRSQNILIHLKKNSGRYEREQAAEFFKEIQNNFPTNLNHLKPSVNLMKLKKKFKTLRYEREQNRCT